MMRRVVAVAMLACLVGCQERVRELQGPEGEQGESGAQGANGVPGNNGLTALVVSIAEPQGANCPAGGTKVLSGLDSNSNGALDIAEVSSTRFVCNGVP